jgi:mono/diheme cytochrome c family protein
VERPKRNSTRRRSSFAFCAIFFVACLIAAALEAQSGKLASDGVYTSAQAERGKFVVQSQCSRCHGDDLAGIEGPALVGAAFMSKWEVQTLDRLFRKIRETMPAETPRAISDNEKLDALAYLLRENGFVAGAEELPLDDDALASIQFRQSAGGRPRDGSVVEVIGCLGRSADNEWVLNSASEPRPTTLESTTAAATAPLGTQVVRLMSVFPNPSSHEGHKMQARGLLVSSPAGDRVNVLTLEMLASTCEH